MAAAGVLEVLAQKGIINRYQADDILEQAQTQFNGDVDAVLELMHIDEGKVLEAKSAFYNIPAVTVRNEDISFDILKYIPEDTAQTYRFVPVGIEDGVLLVGMERSCCG